MSFKSRNGPAATARSAPYSRAAARTGPGGAWLHDLAPGARAARPAPAATNAGSSDISNKLLVSNLHYEVMPKDLVSIFATIGTLAGEPVIRVRVIDPSVHPARGLHFRSTPVTQPGYCSSLEH
ncbi:hypothetical protein BOTBODRAFT_39253 [Botryobasidium botryosum FD-172 SS1]|uniref:RRM domain-containing protein n=1 Tax=Botryobasidium botryosum (strain FD-172 SS1) TaxID=930990 RepID=A0A067LUW1_BOTB1|nr:hypothetical protein BOTBODRAFT_39253 [Botryobasidium botryosum FD-172 SS1]